uniref:Solute carrier family 39 member 2 n=1 Tax=Pelusios castaneus TaxID=367368 RepID=A0A8C8STQ1_9SAUR
MGELRGGEAKQPARSTSRPVAEQHLEPRCPDASPGCSALSFSSSSPTAQARTLSCCPSPWRWPHSNSLPTGRHRRILSFVGCFAAGVFLGACLMHMVADALTDIQGELGKQLQQLDYPFAELIISIGFFLVFLTESLVLHCCRSTRPPPSSPSILHSHGVPAPSGHSPVSFRALVLFVSLSLHSLFEGLAVGVQQGEAGALQLCLAILAHKGVIAFSLGLQLVQSGTRPRWRLLYLGVFALMSPSGMAVGIGLSLSGGAAGGLAMALLEGVAAGTFLYITFLEILPQELSSPEPPLAKFSFIALGELGACSLFLPICVQVP